MPKVIFNYDPVSPFAYMAYVVLCRYRQLWNLDIELAPAFLGGVMKEAENRPPLTIPNKGRYMVHDMKLTNEYFGIDFSMPKDFPNAVKTINTVRFLRQLKDEASPEVLEAATMRFWECSFGPNKRGVNDLKDFPDILKNISGLSAEQINSIAQKSQSAENKERIIKEASTLVHQKKAFGHPWIEVTRDDGKRQNFWGSDRFELMAYYLGKKWEGPHPDVSKAKL